jgi:hypothetical protein
MSKQKIIGYWKENNNNINNKKYEFYKNLKLPIEILQQKIKLKLLNY